MTLAEHRDTGNGETGLVFGIKRPYVIDTNPETMDAGILYGVDLALTRWYAVDKQTLSMAEGYDYAALPFGREQVYQWVNRDIGLTVNAALERYALRYGLPQVQRFYLPLAPGSSGVLRVERPALIVIVEGLSLDGSSKYSYSAVNGIAVSNRWFVYGWTDDTGQWYAYADVTGDIEGDLFLSPEDAARAGYWPWLG